MRQTIKRSVGTIRLSFLPTMLLNHVHIVFNPVLPRGTICPSSLNFLYCNLHTHVESFVQPHSTFEATYTKTNMRPTLQSETSRLCCLTFTNLLFKVVNPPLYKVARKQYHDQSSHRSE